MDQFKNILVAVDTRLDSHPIVVEAVALAKRNQARVTLVDFVNEFPWTVRLTMPDHDHVQELVAKEKFEALDKLVAEVRQQGVEAQSEVHRGTTSEEILRLVQENGHDLVMRVAKGSSSRRRGFFGTTAIHLLRRCPCAVWLVTPDADPKFEHTLACVDTSTGDEVDAELNAEILELALSLGRIHSGTVSVVQAWSIWNEQMLKARMHDDDFRAFEKANEDKVRQLLDEFLQNHEVSARDNRVHVLRGEPQDVIPAFAMAHRVDLVVMGTIGRTGLQGLLMGNTAELILNHLQCSVLALKPKSLR